MKILGKILLLLVLSAQAAFARDPICSSRTPEVNILAFLQLLPFFAAYLDYEKHQRAILDFAYSVYQIPDLDSAKESDLPQIRKLYKQYRDGLPTPYRPIYELNDSATGLKMGVYESKDPADPLVLAFAGTEDWVDALADLSKGRAQMERILQLGIVPRVMGEILQQPRKVVFTGHSLGGGLAQFMAYTIRKELNDRGRQDIQTEVETVNAFGAMEVIQQMQKLDTKALNGITGNHYNFESDILHHFGLFVGGNSYVIKGPPGLLRAHRFTTVNLYGKLQQAKAIPFSYLSAYQEVVHNGAYAALLMRNSIRDKNLSYKLLQGERETLRGERASAESIEFTRFLYNSSVADTQTLPFWAH